MQLQAFMYSFPSVTTGAAYVLVAGGFFQRTMFTFYCSIHLLTNYLILGRGLVGGANPRQA